MNIIFLSKQIKITGASSSSTVTQTPRPRTRTIPKFTLSISDIIQRVAVEGLSQNIDGWIDTFNVFVSNVFKSPAQIHEASIKKNLKIIKMFRQYEYISSYHFQTQHFNDILSVLQSISHKVKSIESNMKFDLQELVDIFHEMKEWGFLSNVKGWGEIMAASAEVVAAEIDNELKNCETILNEIKIYDFTKDKDVHKKINENDRTAFKTINDLTSQMKDHLVAGSGTHIDEKHLIFLRTKCELIFKCVWKIDAAMKLFKGQLIIFAGCLTGTNPCGVVPITSDEINKH